MKKTSFAALAALLLTKVAHADTLATGAPADELQLDDEYVIDLVEPTSLAFLPDGRMLITLRGGTGGMGGGTGSGQVLVVPAGGGEPIVAGEIPVSIDFQEKGLLNVAVHPDYANNHIIFLYYTAATGGGDTNRVVSMELSEDNVLDVASEEIFVEGIAAPLNHDGGGLAVHGNYLYIGTGDSGSNTNKVPYAQTVGNYYPTCLTNLNGKILRLNVDGTIPADNPLIGKMVTACGNNPGTEPTGMGAAREEIFAWGFRNAFRLFADPPTGNLWVGHVGEVTFEMINVVPPTGNKHYGWPFREGGVGFPSSECQNYAPNVGDCVDPVYSCEQSDGQNGTIPSGEPCSEWGAECDNPDVPNQCDSITGGVILNGCEWPDEFRGKYVFGDYSNKTVWTLPVNDTHDDVIGERVNFLTPDNGPVAFAEHAGALYFVGYGGMNGKVTKITPKMSNADCAPTPEPSMTTTDPGPAPSTPEPEPSASEAPGPGPSSAPPTSATPSAATSGPPSSSPTTQTSATSATSTPPAPTSSTSSSPVTPSASPSASSPVGAAPGSSSSGGCGCEVIGNRGNPYAALAIAGLAAAFIGRRRRVH
jgi:MYXO-CTERM domain-containing protein